MPPLEANFFFFKNKHTFIWEGQCRPGKQLGSQKCLFPFVKWWKYMAEYLFTLKDISVSCETPNLVRCQFNPCRCECYRKTKPSRAWRFLLHASASPNPNGFPLPVKPRWLLMLSWNKTKPCKFSVIYTQDD